ncbi:GPI-anchored surface protein, putative [Bodo saltans]|uniref:GPI-anchored surface protein, putative n=1 Tax=Bodo saltans TaxID=75058 RepID=A0A0S4JGP2_BODSA|nr:GPI-anchored surface protein, putative [Bodo saltans]|eukprot:CUG89695.1 GPI-anchored surface protein, putative [Bodo saltans]
MAPRSEWEAPHSSSRHRAEVAFVLKHLEPVFGAYVGRREWYFVVEWSLVAVGGVVTGAASAVAADGDACGAAVWATWCMIVLGAVQIALTVALRPFSVLFEMITSVAIGVLSLLSVVLSLVGAVDAADVTVNVAGVSELVVMMIMLVNVAVFRCTGGGDAERAVVATDSCDKAPDSTPVVIQPARLKSKAKTAQTIERRDQGVDAYTTHSEQLRALIELACARAQV